MDADAAAATPRLWFEPTENKEALCVCAWRISNLDDPTQKPIHVGTVGDVPILVAHELVPRSVFPAGFCIHVTSEEGDTYWWNLVLRVRWNGRICSFVRPGKKGRVDRIYAKKMKKKTTYKATLCWLLSSLAQIRDVLLPNTGRGRTGLSPPCIRFELCLLPAWERWRRIVVPWSVAQAKGVGWGALPVAVLSKIMPFLYKGRGVQRSKKIRGGDWEILCVKISFRTQGRLQGICL